MKNAIVCLSGGIESSTLAYFLKKKKGYERILALYINYEHRAQKEEKRCIKKIVHELDLNYFEVNLPYLKKISKSYLTRKIKIPQIKDCDLNNEKEAIERMKLWWVPSRNAIISVIALSIAESKLLYDNELFDIYIGIRRETPVPMPDNTREFILAVNTLFKHSILTYHLKSSIKIFAPFISLEKEKIIKIGEKLGLQWVWTYSCYSGNSGKLIQGIPVHCGVCSNCKRRKIAFEKAGVKDASIYLDRR